jgi:hypothetical protein
MFSARVVASPTLVLRSTAALPIKGLLLEVPAICTSRTSTPASSIVVTKMSRSMCGCIRGSDRRGAEPTRLVNGRR